MIRKNLLRKLKINSSFLNIGSGALYGILDKDTCDFYRLDIIEFAKGFFNGGGKILQYRDKISTPDTITKNFEGLLKMAKEYKGICILNDYIQIALQLKAPFHLGQEDIFLSDMYSAKEISIPWGRSTHNKAEILNSMEHIPLPSYIGFGSIFKSLTKERVGIHSLSIEDVLCIWPNEVVLIGGISMDNIQQLVHRFKGNSRIFYAVIRDFFRFGNKTNDIEKYTRNFLVHTNSTHK